MIRRALVGAALLALMGSPSFAGGYSGVDDVNMRQSGVTAVTGTFSATGQSASFIPNAGRPFNISITGTFVGTVELDRFLNGAWQPVTVGVNGTTIQLEQWSATASDQWTEPQAYVSYRLNATAYTSGTITYALSQ